MVASTVVKVFCHYCGQGFKRDEHLERHILIHTNVRPFQCQECKVTFKRKDLLSRHYRSIHANGDYARTATSSSITGKHPVMGRIAIACISCAKVKTRCDKQDPCSRCNQKGIACERRRIRRRSAKNSFSEEVPTSTSHVIQTRDDTANHHVGPELVEADMEEPSMYSESRIEQDEPRVPGHRGTNQDNPEASAPTSNEENLDSSLAAYTNVFCAGTEEILFDAAGKQLPATNPSPVIFDADLLSLPHFLDEDQPTLSDRLGQHDYCLAPDLSGTWNNTIDPIDIYDDWSHFGNSFGHQKSDYDDESEFPATLAHLKVLENPIVWSSTLPSELLLAEMADTQSTSEKAISPISRDWLLSATQYIWRTVKQEAMHRVADKSELGMYCWMEKVILLPPADILQKLFQRYYRAERFRFSVFPAPVEELFTSTSKRSGILHGLIGLLIIAKVTRISEKQEVHALSNGLVGLCHSFIQNTNWPAVKEHLEVSIPLIQLLQWSGEAINLNGVHEVWEHQTQHIQQDLLSRKKSRTDSLLAQCTPWCQSTTIENMESQPVDAHSTTSLKTGKIEECRLLYSWLAIDLELSLFHDIQTKLSIQDCPTFRKFALPSTNASQKSLLDLSEAFTDGHLTAHAELTASNLHLLLHPLQCVSARLHQCFYTFKSMGELGTHASATFGLASQALIDELEVLLRRWQQMASRAMQDPNARESIRASLVIYHLIKINSHASFPAIERLFRDHSLHDLVQDWSAYGRYWARTLEPMSLALLIYHCGQCLRYLRTMPSTTRPLWWTVALYRSTLTLSMAIIVRMTQVAAGFRSMSKVVQPSDLVDQVSIVAIEEVSDDEYAAEHATLQALIGRTQTNLVITRMDGSTIVVHGPVDILDYCITLIDEHTLREPTMLAQGVRSKLQALCSRFKGGS